MRAPEKPSQADEYCAQGQEPEVPPELNPAIDNLKRKVTAQASTFRTVSSRIYRAASDPEYDLLVIDECSTVSNADLLKGAG